MNCTPTRPGYNQVTPACASITLDHRIADANSLIKTAQVKRRHQILGGLQKISTTTSVYKEFIL